MGGCRGRGAAGAAVTNSKRAPDPIWNQSRGRRVLLGGNQAWMNKQYANHAWSRQVAKFGTWEGWTMTVKECPKCGTRRSLRSTLALWAGRCILIAIAGVISILSGLSLVMRFFGGH